MGILDRFSLAGKTALVTGAGRGIGRGLALAFAEAGADVALTSRTEEQLEDVAREVEALGRRAIVLPGDVSTADSARAAVEQAIRQLGQLDVLLNAAGVAIRRPAEEVTEEQYDTMLDVNLRGTYFACQAAGRHMLERNTGSIVNIGSLTTSFGLPLRSVYAATKGAVGQLTKTLAVEWAARGVRVNCIAPGWILTPLTRPLHDDPQQSDWITGRTPMGRWGTPEDLQGAAVYLASDASTFMTGQTLYVDGGFIVA
ncbi:MAG: 2-dehydro-3-deoxy-D-gluconate 5-dehydrogenase @ 2-deoxy-D-gluconate 3-dehydrogenase [uncultured Chloroflexi bacterium]|uniref:2-dehydro-3-deoxy-D-gluconate 5-dehydrogenase @ 2-deoxy-D-gluconate 3-dehydrogenase n=1 Tax=uncultured Chloroflexota bacterium TaxID=166587 RepID=A0A6J4K1N6_9CHLR|nr:MAG: 2-dehydro-3-deoxy-D-gluconate 5-dehydrogenase @ 2-deoxy-D-gluconate 3-dehydrogenase [uncultured Chloroflexota bacterium]